MVRFELTTLWSQTRCANRAALHPAKAAAAMLKANFESAANIISFLLNHGVIVIKDK